MYMSDLWFVYLIPLFDINLMSLSDLSLSYLSDLCDFCLWSDSAFWSMSWIFSLILIWCPISHWFIYLVSIFEVYIWSFHYLFIWYQSDITIWSNSELYLWFLSLSDLSVLNSLVDLCLMSDPSLINLSDLIPIFNVSIWSLYLFVWSLIYASDISLWYLMSLSDLHLTYLFGLIYVINLYCSL